MDKARKKELLNSYKETQRKQFEAALPMSRELFQQLFDYLDEQFEESECRHNFDMTITFLEKNNCPVNTVLEWLNENGAGCDCEALFNVEEKFE